MCFYQTKQRLKILFLIMCLLIVTMIPQPKKAEAALPAFLAAAGAVEVGALMFWGGAVLIASAGVAVGLDEEMMGSVEDFGREAWNGANEAIKDSISASVAAMKEAYNTGSTYAVQWSAEAQAYLQAQWLAKFGETTKLTGAGIIVPADVWTYQPAFTNGGRYMYAMEHTGTGIGTYQVIYNFVYPLTLAEAQSDTSTNTLRYKLKTEVVTPDANFPQLACKPYTQCTGVAAQDGSGWSTVGIQNTTLDDQYLYIKEGETYSRIIWANTDIKTADGQIVWNASSHTLTYPTTFPDSVTLPAPRGDVVADGTVVYTPPVIGRVAGEAEGDIAVGYPADGVLTQGNSIGATAVAAPAVTAVEIVDSGTLTEPQTQVDKLKGMVTTRFPFSLPWDMYAILSVLAADPVKPHFQTDQTHTIMGYPIPLKLDIKFDFLDEWMPFFRTFEIIAFCYFLIMVTRKLLGGAT